MADRLDNLKKASGFDKNPQNINTQGRPKKIVTQLKELGYSKDDINQTYMNMCAMNRQELESIDKDKTGQYTIIEQIIAGSLVKSHDKNSLYNIEALVTRVHGKPKETVDNNIKTDEPITITLNLKQ
jgi:hypothetical protein